MNVVVVEPFTKRSALRELADYFYKGHLTREDYVKYRNDLLDYLCKLGVELDPVLVKLLRAAGEHPTVTVDASPKQDKSSKAWAASSRQPASTAVAKKEPSAHAMLWVVAGIVVVIIVSAAAIYFL